MQYIPNSDNPEGAKEIMETFSSRPKSTSGFAPNEWVEENTSSTWVNAIKKAHIERQAGTCEWGDVIWELEHTTVGAHSISEQAHANNIY